MLFEWSSSAVVLTNNDAVGSPCTLIAARIVTYEIQEKLMIAKSGIGCTTQRPRKAARLGLPQD